MPFYPPPLLLAWNMDIRAGTLVVIQDHEVTVRLEATWVEIGAGILMIYGTAIPDLDDTYLVFFKVREEHTSIKFKHCYFGIFYYTESIFS